MPATLSFPIRGDKLSMHVEVREHVYHAKSEFQKIDVYDSEVFGRMLFLDGHIQLTEFDEAAYHEALVQIPLMALQQPKAALVVGGGDGGVIRELCKCSSLELIEMVEIDSGVISAVKLHMPQLPGTAFEDPRVKLHIADAFPFVKAANRAYDLIVVDSTDTYEDEEGELSAMLFTKEFYGDCLRALSEDGLLVTQADNQVFCPYSLKAVLDLFGSVFPRTGSYHALVPSFGGYSGFAWGSKSRSAESHFKSGAFRYLNPQTYALAFAPLCFQ